SPFTYQWYKNSAVIAGATAATYTISSVQTTDAGNYYAIVSNSAGSTTSDTATLTVNPAAVAPAITTQPVSQTVLTGASVTFTAAASGTPTPTYQWQYNGANISGATSASYTIASVATGNAGTYDGGDQFGWLGDEQRRSADGQCGHRCPNNYDATGEP